MTNLGAIKLSTPPRFNRMQQSSTPAQPGEHVGTEGGMTNLGQPPPEEEEEEEDEQIRRQHIAAKLVGWVVWAYTAGASIVSRSPQP